MNLQELRNLLTQEEGITLDFKQEWHDLNHRGAGDRHKHELARDILSLANGNASTAGEKAYLIYGASDDLGPEGRRELVSIPDPLPSRQQILDVVNGLCTPSLDDLSCETLFVDGHRLLVITVPPSQYIHETSRDLQTPQQRYTEHVVFIREGQSIKIANAKERESISVMKRRYHLETYEVPPRIFGAIEGAIVGGAFSQVQFERHPAPANERWAALIISSVFGAGIGALIGNARYTQVDFWRQWLDTPPPGRYIFGASFISFVIAFAAVAGRVLRWLSGLIGSRRSST